MSDSSNSGADDDSIDKAREDYESKMKGISSDALALNSNDIEQSKG